MFSFQAEGKTEVVGIARRFILRVADELRKHRQAEYMVETQTGLMEAM